MFSGHRNNNGVSMLAPLSLISQMKKSVTIAL
jgi:hypothetical protein